MRRELTGILSKDAKVLENTPMKDHTSFKIGGAADLMVIAADEDDVKHTLKFAKENGISKVDEMRKYIQKRCFLPRWRRKSRKYSRMLR